MECYSLTDFAPFSFADVRRHHRRLIGLEQNILGYISEGVVLNLQKEKKNELERGKILITALNSDMLNSTVCQ